MKYALSTNWCNTRLATGEAIVDAALELGFEALELGYNTMPEQVAGFKARLSEMPVGSVHAFCPVPISAPTGHPELYSLASFDEEAAKLATVHVRRNIRFAAEMGADTLVLHAGRVLSRTFFGKISPRKRQRRGEKLLGRFRAALEAILPDLEREKVTLALENLPYLEGFPNEEELSTVLSWGLGDRVKGWFDTGHDRVRECCGFRSPGYLPEAADFAGMHLNDVVDRTDDHFAPSFGKVDFAALKPFARRMRHIVFEPNAGVGAAELKAGLNYIRQLWG